MAVAEFYLKRTARAIDRIEANLVPIMFGWTILMSIACGLRMSFAATPIRSAIEYSQLGALYAIVVAAPIVSAFLALRWFRDAGAMPQPRLRLARVGRWSTIARDEARGMRDFGANGIMFSLLLGMMLNIPL